MTKVILESKAFTLYINVGNLEMRQVKFESRGNTLKYIVNDTYKGRQNLGYLET